MLSRITIHNTITHVSPVTGILLILFLVDIFKHQLLLKQLLKIGPKFPVVKKIFVVFSSYFSIHC